MALPILTPGKPGDLAMVLRVAQESVAAVKDHHEETGELDAAGLRAIAETTCLALEMWNGYRPVSEGVLKGIAEWVN